MIAAWLLWLILATHFDFVHRRVPNWLVLSGLAGATFSLVVNHQPFGISGTDALTGAIVGFVGLLIFYVVGWMGAGDVKFAGALGLWVGLQPLLPIWIGASLLAGIHAVLWLMLQRWPYFPRLIEVLSVWPVPARDGAGKPKRQRHIPYAAYLAIAALCWPIWRNASLSP